MIIYTVKRGDSLYAIARRYEVSAEQLMFDNQIDDPRRLVVGQALVIEADRFPHRVTQGESLYTIARRYGVTPDALRAANPGLSPPYRIFPGQTVTVPGRSEPTRPVAVNGFTVSVSGETLAESLPSLTYVSPFAYRVDAQGALSPPADSDVLIAAREGRAAALMTVVNAGPEGGFSSDIMHAIVTNQTAQDAFLRNTMNTLTQKGYYGLMVDFEYVYPFDRESYNQLLRRLREILHAQGFILATSIAPKTSATQPGTLYEGHDYRVHGEVCDLVVIMTYEWGYTYGPAMAVAPIGPVRQVLEYAVSEIPAHKILMGMPNYAYDWTLPFVQGSAAQGLSNTRAIARAADVGAEIRFDTKAQAPFYNYYDAQGRRHEVWFDDARSIRARLELIEEFGLGGLSYWTIDSLFRQQFLVLKSMYSVSKVL